MPRAGWGMGVMECRALESGDGRSAGAGEYFRMGESVLIERLNLVELEEKGGSGMGARWHGGRDALGYSLSTRACAVCGGGRGGRMMGMASRKRCVQCKCHSLKYICCLRHG